ncbi:MULTISPECIES: hypothetical protein [unclassified Streptomyces]|uniref:hypothetical protein n=1 Tax=unclassified Streptomyces TaxID=2593676 RepID=UPI000DABE5BC|nr:MULTISPECIES: hypothetical protein [unclassified Streptomyces]PZT75935.1 hypothetical protein DNK56_21310 [Streptomyces sp. AC1-42W]PZT80114.1 hypothetical protein DNK55_11375 [Streptomyces sp. AC1-42T]
MPVPPTPADDFAAYLRSYTEESLDHRTSLEDVWDRYHLPDSDHTVNRRHRDRAASLNHLADWRADRSPYELQVHEVVADGRRAAARYTVSRTLLLQVRYNTEVAIFADIGDDGRIASTVSTARMTYGWGQPGDDTPEDDGRPANAGAAPREVDAAVYLTDFARLSSDPSAPLEESYDQYHAPNTVQYINGTAMRRQDVLQALAESRRKGTAYDLSFHSSVSQGLRFAARYTMAPAQGPRGVGDLEVFAFGQFAEDGRVSRLRSVMQTASGYWPA